MGLSTIFAKRDRKCTDCAAAWVLCAAALNGFGEPVSAGSEFKGELTNIDLTADTGLSHTTIEKSPRLHLVIMKKIENVVKKDLAAKVKATKPKTKRQKSNA